MLRARHLSSCVTSVLRLCRILWDYSRFFSVTQVTRGALAELLLWIVWGHQERSGRSEIFLLHGRVTTREKALKMPVIPNSAVLERIAALPLTTHQAGEIVFAAGTMTGRLLILRKGTVSSEKEGTEIAKVTEPGAVFGGLSCLALADCQITK
jgi:hypothetical protein